MESILLGEVVDEKSLRSLGIAYFHQRGYTIEQNIALEGSSGLLYLFDLLIKKGQETHPVFSKEWKRTVGVNMIINADKASENTNLSQPIIIGTKFSDHAKAYSNKRRIILLTKKELQIVK